MKAETVPLARPHPVSHGSARAHPGRDEASASAVWGDLVELAKPRITLMVLVTVAAGASLR